MFSTDSFHFIPNIYYLSRCILLLYPIRIHREVSFQLYIPTFNFFFSLIWFIEKAFGLFTSIPYIITLCTHTRTQFLFDPLSHRRTFFSLSFYFPLFLTLSLFNTHVYSLSLFPSPLALTINHVVSASRPLFSVRSVAAFKPRVTRYGRNPRGPAAATAVNGSAAGINHSRRDILPPHRCQLAINSASSAVPRPPLVSYISPVQAQQYRPTTCHPRHYLLLHFTRWLEKKNPHQLCDTATPKPVTARSKHNNILVYTLCSNFDRWYGHNMNSW